jgi:hypothetical protein
LDLAHYGVAEEGLKIDWSNPCQEGHCTEALDGNLEDLSDLTVVNRRGETIAEGWMDFVHGGGENPLFVFWLFLSILRDGKWVEVKETPTIPDHVWQTLPESTKDLCMVEDGYDARWCKDPLVIEWRKSKAP